MRTARNIALVLLAVYWIVVGVRHFTHEPPQNDKPFAGSVQWETYRWPGREPITLTVDTSKLDWEWYFPTREAAETWEMETDGLIDFDFVSDEWAEDNHADVIVWNGDFGDTDWVGHAEVFTESDGYTLYHAHVQFNDHYDANMVNVACHELGHAIGIDHAVGVPSCMLPQASDNEEPYETDVNVVEKMYGGLAER